MKPNARPEQSLRIEVPLAFCPLFGETQRETNATRGSDNCNPTLEGGGWKPNGTKLAPEEWRNGALIQKVGGTFFKLVWGEQFGFGVRTSPTSPNATGRSHEANDPGCPQGCLFDIIGPLPAPAPVACAQLPTAPQPITITSNFCINLSRKLALFLYSPAKIGIKERLNSAIHHRLKITDQEICS